MGNFRKICKIISIIMGLLILVLDSETAVNGARDAIAMCLRSVIPALFPFIFLSNLLLSSINHQRNTRSNSPGKTGILIAGYLGGYPVGAQCAIQAYRNNQISCSEALKLVICCNNPGPAFIFGITASLFPEKWTALILWGIHIISSLMPFLLLSSYSNAEATNSIQTHKTHTSALSAALYTTGIICGWVILFRIIIHMIQRWFLWMLPKVWANVICGLLEITNGCLALSNLENIGLRFILCALFLSFGGGCTMIQTYSITQGLDFLKYCRCKLMEGCSSFLIAYMVQRLILSSTQQLFLSPFCIINVIAIFSVLAISLLKSKKNSRNLSPIGV